MHRERIGVRGRRSSSHIGVIVARSSVAAPPRDGSTHGDGDAQVVHGARVAPHRIRAMVHEERSDTVTCPPLHATAEPAPMSRGSLRALGQKPTIREGTA
jgi:hypothetical protein